MLAETSLRLGALQTSRDPSTARLLRIREAVASLRMTEPKVASSKRSNTSSTLLEPVVWSCFRILASKDASRISMVMVLAGNQEIAEEWGRGIPPPKRLKRFRQPRHYAQ